MRVAQPALSRQIRDLEAELGFALFVRSTTSVRLTDAGRAFFVSAQKLLGQLAIAVSGAQEVAKGHVGDFNIASDWRIPMHLIPETVRKFRQRNPKVSVNFVDMLIMDQIEALRAGKIHLGFVPEITLGVRDDLELLMVYTGPLMAIVPDSHPLASGSGVKLRDLAGEQWIQVQHRPNSDFREYLVQMCRPAGFMPNFGRNTASASGVLSLVAAGEGVALLPELVVPRSFGGIKALETDCPPMRMYAVWLRKFTSPLVERYVEILCEEIKNLSPAGKTPRRKPPGRSAG